MGPARGRVEPPSGAFGETTIASRGSFGIGVAETGSSHPQIGI